MSDKKQLLEEGTVRRFMQLANIKPLNNVGGEVLEEAKKAAPEKAGEKDKSAKDKVAKEKAAKGKAAKGQVKENARPGVTFMREDDSNATESVMHEVEELEEAEGEEAGGEMDAGMGGMEVDGGEESGDEGGDDVKPEVEALVSALNGLLAKVGKSKYEVDVEAGGEGEEKGEAEGEEAPVMEAEQEEGYGMKKEAKKQAPPAEEEGVYESLNLEVEDDEALAEELTRRVAARLVAEMKKAKKGVTEDFTGGGTKHTKPPKAKGNPSKAGSFGTKGKGR